MSTTKDVFQMAVRRELEAHQIYKRLAEIIEDRSIKVLFQSLSNDELLHKDYIELLYKDMFGTKLEIDLTTTDIKLPVRFGKEYALEVIDSAISKEKEAYDFYSKMASESNDKTIKRLFELFAEMENGHFELLRAERNRMIEGYYWFTQNEDRVLED